MRLFLSLLLAAPLLAQQIPVTRLPVLKDILSLTADQVQKITTLYDDYAKARAAGNKRMSELNLQILERFSQPNPDASQIGAAYAEAESVRRDLAMKQATYRAQVRATLTAAQQMQYQMLLNSITLEPLLSEAACAFLQDSRTQYTGLPFLTPFPGNIVPTVIQRSGDFTLISGNLFTRVVLPYIPPPPGADFCGSRVFPLALRQYLNMTDAQVAAVVQANSDYRDIYQRRQDRIADVEVEIRDETAKDQPDPNALGVRYVELQLLSQDLQYQADQLRQRARAALTGDQAVRLKALDDLAATSPTLNVLQGCDLLIVPPGAQYPAPGNVVFAYDPTSSLTFFSGSCRVS